jgi:hypothetical protein
VLLFRAVQAALPQVWSPFFSMPLSKSFCLWFTTKQLWVHSLPLWPVYRLARTISCINGAVSAISRPHRFHSCRQVDCALSRAQVRSFRGILIDWDTSQRGYRHRRGHCLAENSLWNRCYLKIRLAPGVLDLSQPTRQSEYSLTRIGTITRSINTFRTGPISTGFLRRFPNWRTPFVTPESSPVLFGCGPNPLCIQTSPTVQQPRRLQCGQLHWSPIRFSWKNLSPS